MLIRLLFWVCVAGAAALLIPRLFTEVYSINKLFKVDTVPQGRVAIVFGAGLQRDGSPSPILRDRVETAVELYRAGKVEKLLMSGDNRFVDYNEPGAMRAYALDLGVPEEDIVLDYAGRRTFDTCYRTKNIFGIDEAILVTQKYHITRALFTCNGVGVKSVGVPSDVRTYRKLSRLIWNVREMPATLVALWDVWIAHPAVVLGDFEPIFPVNGQNEAQ